LKRTDLRRGDLKCEENGRFSEIVEKVQAGLMANLHFLWFIIVRTPKRFIGLMLSLNFEGRYLVCNHAVKNPDDLYAVSQDAQPNSYGVDLG